MPVEILRVDAQEPRYGKIKTKNLAIYIFAGTPFISGIYSTGYGKRSINVIINADKCSSGTIVVKPEN